MIEKQYTFLPSTGFARPASMLAIISDQYLSTLVLEYEGNSIELHYSPQSIMDVMSLEITPGSPFRIRAEGTDGPQALKSIEDNVSEMKLMN